jgi:hypothetical protein
MYGIFCGRPLFAQHFNGLDHRKMFSAITVWRDSESDLPVNLPVHLPESRDQIRIHFNFEIPDSLRSEQIRFWLPQFSGDLAVSANDHLISQSGVLVAPAYVDIPVVFIRYASINKISLELSRPAEGSLTPVGQFREKEMPGILSDTYLEWRPSLCFSDFRYDFSGDILNYRFQIEANLPDSLGSRPAGKLRYVEEVFSPEGRSLFNRFEFFDYQPGIRTIERNISIPRLQMWSPDDPVRYLVRLKLYSSEGLIDEVEYRPGLRRIAINNGKILLDGQPLIIKGVTYRDTPFPAETAGSLYRRLLSDMVNIKASGLNAVRIPHHTPHPYLFDIADSLGLLLFTEMELWRQPESYFREDENLASYKHRLLQVADIVCRHPSSAALGLGHEIPLTSATVQKFILIAREFLKQEHDLLTYLSPLDARELPSAALSELYFVNKYDASILAPLSNFISPRLIHDYAVLIGNAGIASDDSTGYAGQLRSVLSHLNNESLLDGYFIESYRDWIGDVASPVTLRSGQDTDLYSYGMRSITGAARIQSAEVETYLNERDIRSDRYVSTNRSNVFTVTTFIAAILFFLVYRNNFRLRDNLKRSLMHSHGFFVDLRDRRIIALLNSAIVGLFTNLQVSVIISAFFYHTRLNLQVSEMVSSLLSPLDLYVYFYDLTGQPLLLLFMIWISLYFGQLSIAIFLKLFNFFSRETIRFRQSIAICHWAGSPLIFLLPVSLFSLQILALKNILLPLFLLLLLFFFWFNFRLASGIRVLLVINAYKVFTVLILTYCLCVFIFFAFLNGRSDLLAYLNLLTRAGNLF